ncbi:MAG TPA: sulfurtransferase [bacterium]|nr:sulfurtransferase [bacterium]
MRGSTNLVTAEWLAGRLDDPAIVIADCRFDLAKPDAGRAEYARDHIPGAVYLDLETDLSAPKADHGGRHPLPAIESLARLFGRIGIDGSTTVIVYDAQSNCMAARFWWMLRYLGHDAVKVLDGGWSAWRLAGHPTTADVRPGAERVFVPRVRTEMLVDMVGLRRRLSGRAGRLVDSRAPERYRGEVEPLDPVAGHIPGAINLPWTENQDDGGMLKPIEVLRRRFSVIGSEQPVVYCGSGVSACSNLLAMDEIGIRNAVLYAGSWSDWCSYPENPVAKKE